MARRSFKITPATIRPGAQLKQPDYWVLMETTGGKAKEIRRFPTYPEAIQANWAICSGQPL